jgi:type IV pilus assembly protein PilX
MKLNNTTYILHLPQTQRVRGASLIIVMLLLIVISILGVGGAQIAMMSERGARNDRDMNIAVQGAEAGLLDAEFDMRGPGTSPRKDDFLNEGNFPEGCGTTGVTKGLCAQNFDKPVWKTVDLTDKTGPSTAFGEQTGRSFQVGAGIQASKKPHYIVEVLPDAEAFGDKSIKAKKLVYRVTSMGFGPRDDIQAVHQMVFRKD